MMDGVASAASQNHQRYGRSSIIVFWILSRIVIYLCHLYVVKCSIGVTLEGDIKRNEHRFKGGRTNEDFTASPSLKYSPGGQFVRRIINVPMKRRPQSRH
jgi:hypothetical protein